ncbi:MAG: cysteine synthase A [Pseudomonadota bacterium]
MSMHDASVKLTEAIGNTPLLRLNRLSDATGCEILGKAEFMNPGGSVKDRAALGMVRTALERGELTPGGTIIEGTAGNTGIGLAMVGNALGCRTLIVMPQTQSQEKIDTLRAYGAEVRLIPAVPFRNPEHFVHVSGRLAAERNAQTPGSAFWPNQFDNVSNREYHEQTTGPEILAQTNGAIDAFVCAVGTGGTLGGVARALKAHDERIVTAVADPHGSGLHSYFTCGEIEIDGNSITEGIGNSRVTANLEGTPVDRAYRIADTVAVPLVFDLIRDEGLVLGGSSGINVAAAVRLARELGPGHTVVTLLCDSGLRYASRLFNPEFLRSKGLEPFDPAPTTPAN